MNKIMRPEQQYIDLYAQAEALLRAHSTEPLNRLRARAFADFERLGFPTRRQEDCKYTDVPRAFEPDYGMNLKRLPIPVNPYEVFKCDVPNMSTSLFFVVNDALSYTEKTLPDGVILGNFRDYPELVERYLGTLADTSRDGLTAFNTAFAQDGVLLYVPRGVIVEKPIQLINILRSDVPLLVNRRVLIVLEDGAQARLLVCDHTMDEVNFLATQVIEVFAGRDSVFDLYELEETHTGTTRLSNLYVRQEAGSNVLLNGMTLTNGTTRNSTRVLLAGENASLDLCGMAIADRNQHVDTRTVVEHAVPSCTSRQLFKNVLDDHATGAFSGLVLVRPRRAAHRCPPNQPQPLRHPRRPHVHPAPAGNLCRRREVQPRRHGGPAGRCSPLLHAPARHPPARSPPAADVRLRGRGGRHHPP